MLLLKCDGTQLRYKHIAILNDSHLEIKAWHMTRFFLGNAHEHCLEDASRISAKASSTQVINTRLDGTSRLVALGELRLMSQWL
jgi:hypothetical protein